MKPLDPHRFQKRPEAISFTGAAIPNQPVALPKLPKAPGRADEPTSGRSIVRPDVRTLKSQRLQANTYTIEIPAQRRKVRHPFDVFEDQVEALKKIQLARREQTKSKQAPTLGEMVQEALDQFIQAKAKKVPNLQVKYEARGAGE